jgi:Fe-S cluster assembly iron-binding protein IscA
MSQYGLSCFHCDANAFESLVDGCRSHGFGEEEIDALVGDINDLIASLPDRPETLIITIDAARALRQIAEQENKLTEILVVIADGKGSFCLEFQSECGPDDRLFTNIDVPDIRFGASLLTLKRIGGATIDMRDGRFKLDLPEAAHSSCACKNGGECACKNGGTCGCKK